MLIERNLAPVFTLAGGALVFPHVIAHWQTGAVQPIGSLVAGSALGAAGLFMSTMLLLESGHPLRFRVVAGAILCAITLAFVGGAGLVALHARGGPSLFLGTAALLPALGFGVALYAVLKD
jgi:hypothetical protein